MQNKISLWWNAYRKWYLVTSKEEIGFKQLEKFQNIKLPKLLKSLANEWARIIISFSRFNFGFSILMNESTIVCQVLYNCIISSEKKEEITTGKLYLKSKERKYMKNTWIHNRNIIIIIVKLESKNALSTMQNSHRKKGQSKLTEEKQFFVFLFFNIK